MVGLWQCGQRMLMPLGAAIKSSPGPRRPVHSLMLCHTLPMITFPRATQNVHLTAHDMLLCVSLVADLSDMEEEAGAAAQALQKSFQALRGRLVNCTLEDFSV